MEGENNTAPAAPIQSELESMRIAGEAIESLSDPKAQLRVLSWLASRFGLSPLLQQQEEHVGPPPSRRTAVISDQELPGIARLNASGNLEITARDLKAKSAVDAAVRLAHVVIYANEKLKGEQTVSSRKVLSPILKEWRLYDGNTRGELARQKGIRRDEDLLSLDAIAKTEAEKYVAEILDNSIQGTWDPNRRSSKRVTKRAEATPGETTA